MRKLTKCFLDMLRSLLSGHTSTLLLTSITSMPSFLELGLGVGYLEEGSQNILYSVGST